jgi:hypothetical protein
MGIGGYLASDSLSGTDNLREGRDYRMLVPIYFSLSVEADRYEYCWENKPLSSSFLIKIVLAMLRNKTQQNRTL